VPLFLTTAWIFSTYVKMPVSDAGILSFNFNLIRKALPGLPYHI
jgi:hypothetical protein